MAFTYTVTGRESLGSVWFVYGTYTNGANDSGGVITVGMSNVMSFDLLPSGKVHEVMSKQTATASDGAGTVTIVTPDGSVGTWSSIGK